MGSQALPKNWQEYDNSEGSYSRDNPMAVKKPDSPFSSHKTFQVGSPHPSLHSPNHLEPKLSHCFLFKPLPVWLEGRQKQCERVRVWDTHHPLRSPSSNSSTWLIGSLRVRQGLRRATITVVQSPTMSFENHASGTHTARNVASVESVIQWDLPLYKNIANTYISPIEPADITKYKDLCWFLTPEEEEIHATRVG